jgi:poly-gamma-glutamate synthesis protein (capsule biosynthesis protein)
MRMPLLGLLSVVVIASAFVFQITRGDNAKIVISGIVVPHHDLVKALRQQMFAQVGKQMAQPATVILISPNHYDAGGADVQTSVQTWHTADGDIVPNRKVVTALASAGVTQEPSSFDNEHGIRLLLGDLKQTFPGAKIVPLIFKIRTPLEKVTAVEKVLEETCADCVVIASVDFSHYQPALLANQHDSLTVRALQNLDQATLMNNAETDSPPALALLAQWALSHHTEHFTLWKHANSGELLHSPDIESTTHVFGWYEAGKKVEPKHAVSFLIGGDMMFGRMIAHTFLGQGLSNSLDQLGDRVFWGSDADIINLEGPVSDVPVPDDYRSTKLIFHFPPQAIDALKYLHVNVASLANNHSANAGDSGLATTRRLLQAANINPLGGPGQEDVSRIVTIPGATLKLAIIGVHTLIDVPDIAPLIKKVKQDPNVRVLVFPHGGVEYAPVHSVRQQELAHYWIDAGADAVIGSHPHVVQDSEVYKGKPIIYSLGNLLFDQNFSPQTQQGMLVAGEFTDAGLQLYGLPVQSVRYKPQFMRGAPKQKLLDALYAPLAAFRQQTPAGDVLFFPN